MKTLLLKPQFYLPNLTNPQTNPSFLIPTRITSKHKKNPTKTKILPAKKPSFTEKSLILSEIIPKSKNPSSSNEEILNGYSRNLILGAVSVGFVLFLMGIDEQSRALALGPEGPLMEEFWDNMRRYGLYVLTVSTGVLYAVFEPIVELLKNPISAILILTIIGGGVFIVSQVVSAMVGVSEFSYDYSY